MNIKEMHYDFKKKFNKIDSNNNRNFLVPEIDWVLNEAQNLFIKMVAEPRFRSALGFETTQRSIDDIRTIVVSDSPITPLNNMCTLPSNYMYYVKGYCTISKGTCLAQRSALKIMKHDETFEESPFDDSSFEWREVNALFVQHGLKLFTDNFTVDKVFLSYIKKPRFIHNAEDFKGGQYNLLNGTTLTATANCELPVATHSDIVDLAVLLATGEIQSDLQSKILKLNLTNLR